MDSCVPRKKKKILYSLQEGWTVEEIKLSNNYNHIIEKKDVHDKENSKLKSKEWKKKYKASTTTTTTGGTKNTSKGITMDQTTKASAIKIIKNDSFNLVQKLPSTKVVRKKILSKVNTIPEDTIVESSNTENTENEATPIRSADNQESNLPAFAPEKTTNEPETPVKQLAQPVRQSQRSSIQKIIEKQSTVQNQMKKNYHESTAANKKLFFDHLEELTDKKISKELRELLAKYNFDCARTLCMLKEEDLQKIEKDEKQKNFKFNLIVKNLLKILAYTVNKKGPEYWKKIAVKTSKTDDSNNGTLVISLDTANLSKYDESTPANQDVAESLEESKFIQELEKLNNNKPITLFMKHILTENEINDVSTLAELDPNDRKKLIELVEKDMKNNPEDYKDICPNNQFSIENKILLERLIKKTKEKLEEEKEIAEESETNPIYKKNFRHMLNGTIKEMIKSGYYVDKTKYFQNLIEGGGCYLITRPRCFGKTRMLETIAKICEGEDSKKLFKNTAIGKSPTYQWKKYPVFEFNFFMLRYSESTANVEKDLIWQIIQNCERYYIKVDRNSWTIPTVFKIMMEGVAELKNDYESKVVILIDEYDEPLYHSCDSGNENEITKIMQEFCFCITNYLKSKIQMVLILGAAKLYMTKIFNNSVNNFVDITLDENINAICGYTHSELITVFEDKLDEKCRENNVTKDELLATLKREYGGYKFSKSSKETIYKPWYIGRYLKSNHLGSTWQSKNQNHFIDVAFMDIEIMLLALKDPLFFANNSDLSQLNYDDKYDQLSLKSFLFQTGLLTIDNYNKETQKYTLKIPNRTAEELIETRTKYAGFFYDLKRKRDLLLKISKDRDVKVFIDCLQLNLSKWPYNNKQCEPTAYHMYLCDVIQEIYQLTTDKSKNACEPTREDVIVTTFKCMYMSQLNYILEKLK